MRINDGTDQIQLSSAETLILGELNGLKPELARLALSADMNVRRFIAIDAVEIEEVRARDAMNSGHAGNFADEWPRENVESKGRGKNLSRICRKKSPRNPRPWNSVSE
jgi:hypothetical protein